MQASYPYYVANEPRMRGRTALDLAVDPPPDLVVEVDVTRSSIDRLSLYATLGAPEVWRYDKNGLHVMQLQPDGSYTQQERSHCFAFLPLDEFRQFLTRRRDTDETTWIRTFRAWAATLR